MCELCESFKKVGCPVYVCIGEISESAKKTKEIKIKDLLIRKKIGDNNG